MKEVYITGHRNPDMDSVCSAYAYAALKNKLSNGEFHYNAVRCGHLGEGQKKQFAEMGITPPPYMRDVKPKVADVMLREAEQIQAKEPIYDLVKTYNASHPSAFPVFDGNAFRGLLSIDDITAWFLRENADENPVYSLTEDNVIKVLHGEKLSKDKVENFDASIMVGAAAFEEFTHHLEKRPNSILVLGYRKDHIEYAIQKQIPAIVITTTTTVPDIDFSSYKGLAIATNYSTADTVRKLRMSPEISTIMTGESPKLQINDLFDEAKDALKSSHLRGLPVFDRDRYVGYVTRRCFLEKPKYNVILMDHNEQNQSIRGIEGAKVREIIDHHRLDALKTDEPIYIDAEPLGSTCTIVYRQYKRNGIVPDRDVALVLLTGIVADTIILKSPTTTEADKECAEELAKLCNVDIQKYGASMFSKAESLGSLNPKEAIMADFKTYNEKGVKMGIGQCETTTLKDLSSYQDMYLETLKEIQKDNHLDWAMLMITDVLREVSVLLTTENDYTRKMPYHARTKTIIEMPGVLSRKKQLLPLAIHAIELSQQ